MDTADKLEEELRRARKELADYNRDVRDGLTRHDPAEYRALRIRIDVCQESLTNHYRLKQQGARG